MIKNRNNTVKKQTLKTLAFLGVCGVLQLTSGSLFADRLLPGWDQDRRDGKPIGELELDPPDHKYDYDFRFSILDLLEQSLDDNIKYGYHGYCDYFDEFDDIIDFFHSMRFLKSQPVTITDTDL